MEHSIFQQAMIYLGSAVFMVPLAKRFGLGSVLGYLIAGVVIGPYVLGWTGDSGDLMGFAEMGVVMMLFLIGLDLQPKTLWQWRRAILGMGSLQVLVTALVIAIVAFYGFHLSANQSIAIGLIFSMSSTAIVVQTMTENNWMQTSAGHNAFSVLLFQDVAAIVILIVLPLLAPSGGPTNASAEGSTEFLLQFPAWMRTLVVFGAIAAIVIGGKYLSRPLFQMVAATNLRELFAAMALLIVLGISALMSLVGLSPALGAFLGGVVLANSEYRHELEGEIEPFKGLLLGLFFIIIGASIDFHLIEQKPVLITLLVLGVMITKLLLLCGLGAAFRMSRKQFLLFGFALSQVGEFAFVLLTFSKNQGIFSEDMAALFVVVVAVSMSFSPVFMIFLDKIWMAYVYNRLNKYLDRFLLIKKGPVLEDGAPQQDIKKSKVLIAGYGRFGSVIGRFLKVNGVESTILDVDSDRIETLRKMGVTAYFGDALRLDLLKSAGADEAYLIIVALNGQAKNLQLVKILQKHFPQAHIIARAHDHRDAYDLMDAGVLYVYRETLDTSLRAGRDALSILGVDKRVADRAAKLFLEHDEKTIKALSAARFDEKEYYRLIRSGISNMQLLMQNDMVLQNLINQEATDSKDVVDVDSEKNQEETSADSLESKDSSSDQE